MKRFVSILAVVAVALTIAQVASAGPIYRTLTLPTAATGIGIATDSLSLAYISPNTFKIPATTTRAGYMLSVYAADTSANTVDSVVFVLLHRPDAVSDIITYASTAKTKYASGWTAVYTFAAKPAAGTNFPLTKFIPLDSLAIYPIIPGTYTWAVYGGVTDVAHVLNKAYKFRCIVECAEAN